MRLLLAEDERDLNRILTKRLTEEGYGVDSCFDGAEALDYLRAADYDGAILDVMMPKMDGFAVLARLREEGIAAPVLFLTARDAVEDRVHGLDLGASDYLVKPFSMEELLARVRVLVRQGSGVSSSVLAVGDLRMDLAAHTVSRAGRPIALSAREFALLAYFMHNPNIVLSREKIEDHVWNFEYEGGTNVVDVYVRYLRKKIDEGEERKLLHTVRGSGYVLREED
ncbi:MAG: response regulator transcription factor [Oscillospiraceae bacterium]|nr:response regulator transcription factor [Oscillospiraceae bacterium]